MKKSPHEQKLEAMLRSSNLVAGGFMGEDLRGVSEIIESDLATLARLHRSARQVASRMREITQKATAGLGRWVEIDADRFWPEWMRRKGGWCVPGLIRDDL